MFEPIENYIEKTYDERTDHLNLEADCIEIGTNSTQCRALLAHFLKTTVPSGFRIHLCHKCHNDSCSNPEHMYWGKPKENIKDSIDNGTHINIYEASILKYGREKYHSMLSKTLDKHRSKGSENSAKVNKLNNEKIEFYKKVIDDSEPMKRGWIKRSKDILGISHTQVKRFVKKYYSDLEYK